MAKVSPSCDLGLAAMIIIHHDTIQSLPTSSPQNLALNITFPCGDLVQNRSLLRRLRSQEFLEVELGVHGVADHPTAGCWRCFSRVSRLRFRDQLLLVLVVVLCLCGAVCGPDGGLVVCAVEDAEAEGGPAEDLQKCQQGCLIKIRP